MWKRLALLCLVGSCTTTGAVTAEGIKLLPRAGGYVCTTEHAEVVSLAYSAVLHDAHDERALKEYPPRNVPHICLVDDDAVRCGLGRPLAGCVIHEHIFVALRAGDWRRTLVHEIIGHLIYANAIDFGTGWQEGNWINNAVYRRVLAKARGRL